MNDDKKSKILDFAAKAKELKEKKGGQQSRIVVEEVGSEAEAHEKLEQMMKGMPEGVKRCNRQGMSLTNHMINFGREVSGDNLTPYLTGIGITDDQPTIADVIIAAGFGELISEDTDSESQSEFLRETLVSMLQDPVTEDRMPTPEETFKLHILLTPLFRESDSDYNTTLIIATLTMALLEIGVKDDWLDIKSATAIQEGVNNLLKE